MLPLTSLYKNKKLSKESFDIISNNYHLLSISHHLKQHWSIFISPYKSYKAEINKTDSQDEKT